MRSCLVISLVAFFALALPVRGQVSLRTNLAWDAVAEPNLGVEVAVSDHWSVGADGGLKAWPRWLAWDWDTENPTHWRNFAVVPEVRYYFRQVYQGLFVGADILYTHFNVGAVTFPFGLYPAVREHRLQGDLVGAGPLVGRSFPLGAHWRLEAQLGVAVGYYWAARYGCQHCDSIQDNPRGVTVVPKLGVNVIYDLRRPKARNELMQQIEKENNNNKQL